MTPEMLITLTAARTLQRMVVPGTARPFWTVAEAGQACAGLEPEIFAALLYSYAGADDVYKIVSEGLTGFAEAMRAEEEWSMQVAHDDGTRSDYVRDLVRIALIEERQQWRFATATIGNNAPTVSPFYLAVSRVSEIVWIRRLAHPYATIRWRYITWLSIGRAHMKRWMRREAFGELRTQVHDTLESGRRVG